MKRSTGNTLPYSLFSVFMLFFILVFAVTGSIQAQETRLIIRGDDMGMTQGSLVAFERAFNQGVLTSASVQVPAPWFEGAAELCRKNPGWCTGVHLTLVGEWQGYRWRPVLPWNEVSSLVDEDGYLYGYPEELYSHNPKPEEIEAELRAQMELARKKGINIQYVDAHYFCPMHIPEGAAIVRKIAKDYDVPLSSEQGEQAFGNTKMGIYTVPVGQKTEKLVEFLRDAGPGLWLLICHPGIDSPEQNALMHFELKEIVEGGGVGKHRADVLKTLTSFEVKSMIVKKQIRLTNYRELWAERKK